jgi:hypothetical protein
MTDVFLLFHISHLARDVVPENHLDEDGTPLCDEQAGDDVKILGVYTSEAAAEAQIAEAQFLPGFRDERQCFQITPYRLDHDHWAEGFVVVE